MCCMIDDHSFPRTLGSSDQLTGPLCEMLDFPSIIRDRTFASTLQISNSFCVVVWWKKNGLFLNWYYFEARNSSSLVRERRGSVANLGAVINLSFVSTYVITAETVLYLTPGIVLILIRNWLSSTLVQTKILEFILKSLVKWSTRSSLTENGTKRYSSSRKWKFWSNFRLLRATKNVLGMRNE